MPDLTYPEVGQSLGALPGGHHHVERTAIVGRGEGPVNRAVQARITTGYLKAV